MEKLNRHDLFVEAHQMAKVLKDVVNDYRLALSIALKRLYARYRAAKAKAQAVKATKSTKVVKTAKAVKATKTVKPVQKKVCFEQLSLF